MNVSRIHFMYANSDGASATVVTDTGSKALPLSWWHWPMESFGSTSTVPYSSPDASIYLYVPK